MACGSYIQKPVPSYPEGPASDSGRRSDFLPSLAAQPLMPVSVPEIVVPGRIFVGGIPHRTSENELRNYFSRYGSVREVKIVHDRDGTIKGYGFVTFDREEVALNLVNQPDGLFFKERRLHIGHAVRRRTYAPAAQLIAPTYSTGCSNPLYQLPQFSAVSTPILPTVLAGAGSLQALPFLASTACGSQTYGGHPQFQSYHFVPPQYTGCSSPFALTEEQAAVNANNNAQSNTYTFSSGVDQFAMDANSSTLGCQLHTSLVNLAPPSSFAFAAQPHMLQFSDFNTFPMTDVTLGYNSDRSVLQQPAFLGLSACAPVMHPVTHEDASMKPLAATDSIKRITQAMPDRAACQRRPRRFGSQAMPRGGMQRSINMMSTLQEGHPMSCANGTRGRAHFVPFGASQPRATPTKLE